MKYSALNLLIKNKFPPRIRQLYVALGPTLVTISLGMAEGYSATLLPQLSEDQDIILDNAMESWIASMAALPMPIACVFGGLAMEIIGRRAIHMVCCFLCIAGWLILALAHNYYNILVGRCITGICVGLLGPPTGVYLAETSEPKFRGFILALISFAIAFGISLSHLLGTFFHWKMVSLICCVFPVASFLVMLLAPESPTYLAKKGRISTAKEAFYWCRGRNMAAENELAILLQRQSQLIGQNVINFRNYIRPEFLKPLLVLIVFFFTAQWCGSNAITFYNVTILQMTLQGRIDEYFSMIVMDIVRLACSILACFLLKVLRRRQLAMLSCIGTFMSLLILSCSMYVLKHYPNYLPNSHFIILSAFISYMGFLTIGLIPLPWTMAGEIFPLASRGMGSGISSLVSYAFIFSVVKTTPWIFSNLQPEGAFFLYAGMTLFGLIVLAIFLPETKDKPLHAIEDGFKGVKG